MRRTSVNELVIPAGAQRKAGTQTYCALNARHNSLFHNKLLEKPLTPAIVWFRLQLSLENHGMDTDNRVLNPNPYGSIGTQEIEQFEARLPHRLPQDYRDYLLQNNGGDFEKRCFVSKNNAEITHSVSQLFSLFRGPENARLETHWSLSEYYDLQELSHLTKEYLVFGVTGTGDLFLLGLGRSDVLIYLHDYVEHTPIEGPGGAIIPLACSFSEFVSNMVSEEVFLQRADEIEPGVTARLKRLKKESGMWD